MNLKTQLSATPVSALCVPLNRVIGSQTNPVWQRAILPLLLGKRPLGAECFLGRLSCKAGINRREVVIKEEEEKALETMTFVMQ